MVLKRHDQMEITNPSSEEERLLLKFLEEKKVNEELKEKIFQLEAQVSSLQGSLAGLRDSTTYKVGLAVANSKSLKAFMELPVEIYKIFKEYKKKNKTINIYCKEKAKKEKDSDQEENKSRDVDKIWIVPSLFTKDCHQVELSGLIEDGFKITEKIPVGKNKEVTFFTEKLATTDLLYINSNITIVIDAFSSDNKLLYSKKIVGPVNGLEKNETLADKALAFLFKSGSGVEYVTVTVFDDLGRCESLKRILKYSILDSGVSVIVPTYKGEEHLSDCLNSLVNQTISKEMMEIVIIINGGPDGSEDIIENFKETYSDLSFVIVKEPIAGASLARNVGIYYASKQYITFLDDDDRLSEEYLEKMYEASVSDQDHIVALSSLLDISANSVIESPINYQVSRALSRKKLKYSDVTSLLTMNACKLMPSFYIKQLRYNPIMKSGEDVCFFTRYFLRYSPVLTLNAAKEGAIYYRTIRPGSVSRKVFSFEFNVRQRVEVINSINLVASKVSNVNKRKFAASKISAQSDFIYQYLKNNMDEYVDYVELLDNVEYIVPFYNLIASKLSDTLVYSYCFIPYVDTAAVVMAKRIRELGKPVDVIFNDMSKVRKKNNHLEEISKGFIGESVEVKESPSFSNWKSIEKFIEAARVEAINLSHKKRKDYSEIYSRVMWPGSHFAALLHKIRNNDVRWVAEFSDPVLKDINGNDRLAKLDIKWLQKNNIINELKTRGFCIPETDNMFFWCEYLTYVFADEVVFTNKNQLKYMSQYINNMSVESELLAKSVINPHPTLPEKYYLYSSPSYHLDPNKVNFAYFGDFYATRGMSYIFKAISSLPLNCKEQCQFHIFTNNKAAVSKEVETYGVEKEVIINDYVGYFDFLALTNEMDCLIVNDAVTQGVKVVNPYLPSKYSDYLGSSSRIWGVCERGSVLSTNLENGAKNRVSLSYLGDYESIYNVLVDIINRY